MKSLRGLIRAKKTLSPIGPKHQFALNGLAVIGPQLHKAEIQVKKLRHTFTKLEALKLKEEALHLARIGDIIRIGIRKAQPSPSQAKPEVLSFFAEMTVEERNSFERMIEKKT